MSSRNGHKKSLIILLLLSVFVYLAVLTGYQTVIIQSDRNNVCKFTIDILLQSLWVYKYKMSWSFYSHYGCTNTVDKIS